MSLIIFNSNYQTYPNPGLPSNLLGSANGVNYINWTTTQQGATGPVSYSTGTSGVNAVLLNPDVQYTQYLNMSGAGGAIVSLQFTPTGSISGPTVTEDVLVGSFAPSVPPGVTLPF